MIIALSTFIAQIIGPSSVKYAVKKSGEAGMRITEEDLIESFKVADMVNRTAKTFLPYTPLETVLSEIAETDELAYPVVDDSGILLGIVSLNELRHSFMSRELNRFLVIYDMMEPPTASVTEETPLAEALSLMKRLEVEFLPVITAQGEGELVGMVEQRGVHRAISREIMRRHQVADGQSDELVQT